MEGRLNRIREAYKDFYYGKRVEQMPRLIAEGKVPMNIAQLMQRRLDFRDGPREFKSAWLDNYFCTGDAVVSHLNGDVKVVLDSQPLREMNPESQRNGGALVLDEDVYRSLPGEVFKKGNLGKINGFLSREEVKAHPVWKVLARDQSLLNDYTDMIFAESMERFGSFGNLMGVYCPTLYDIDKPEMRAWIIGRIEFYHKSDAFGWGDFGERFPGYLVGISPEVQGKDSSSVRADSIADVQIARRNLDQTILYK